MKIALTPMEKFRAAGKFLDVKFNQRPLSVSIEVTKRCNARCDFCDYWKITDRDEMADYVDVVRRFDPLVVVFTGGEPLLRRDLVPLITQIRDIPGFRYLTVLTPASSPRRRSRSWSVPAFIRSTSR
jgi:MoaA/NifB/PqqE/SkfB family radical SAM enzyme